MARGIDWEKSQQRRKFLRNRDAEHMWLSSIDAGREWVPLELSQPSKGVIDFLYRSRQRRTRKVELLQDLQEICDRAVLEHESLRELDYSLAERAASLVRKICHAKLEDADRPTIQWARQLFRLHKDKPPRRVRPLTCSPKPGKVRVRGRVAPK